MYGKGTKHSLALRSGVAETLALLAARPMKDFPELPGRVNFIVRKLLEGRDWKRWASLSPQLPLLAEAAPDVFIELLKEDLKKPEPAVMELFEPEGDWFNSRHTYSGVIWALEGLAWHRDWLPRVSSLLARIAELDHNAKSGNRAMRTLHEIFQAWYPQTAAPVNDRIGVLEKLLKDHAEVGWRLQIGLLPQRMQTSTPTRRPVWRDWTSEWQEGASNADTGSKFLLWPTYSLKTSDQIQRARWTP